MRHVGIAFLAVLVSVCGVGAAPVTISEACAEVRRQIAGEREALAAQRAAIASERQTLRRQASDLAAERRQLEADTAQHRQEIVRQRQGLEERRAANAALERQEQRVWDLLRLSANEFTPLFQLAFPRSAKLRQWLADLPAAGSEPTDAGPHLAGLEELHREYFARAAAVVQGELSATPTGQAVALRIGLLGGIYWRGEESGLLYPRGGGQPPRLFANRLQRKERRALELARDPAADPAPVLLDLSQGMALARLEQRRTWREFFEAGGIIMYPILLIGVLALLMIAERACFYAFAEIRGNRLRRHLPELIREAKLAAAEQELEGSAGPMKRVWQKGIELVRRRSANLEEALQEAILAEVPVLERFLSNLAVFAAVAPLLGLLGTVSGMIQTFETITLYGAGNAGMLSGGISEALITTETGLAVAIPILLAHAALARRAKVLIGHMDQAAMAILDAFARQDQDENHDAASVN